MTPPTLPENTSRNCTGNGLKMQEFSSKVKVMLKSIPEEAMMARALQNLFRAPSEATKPSFPFTSNDAS